MSHQTIDLQIDERGVAYLHMARAEKHNALSARMLDELTDAACDLDGRAEVRAVVLGGRGASFCAGADLGWMRGNLARGREERIAESRRFSKLLRAFDGISKLLVARVHGPAYAGGAGLVAVCDIAIGAREARFSLTETRLGLAPANIAPAIIARIGAHNARRCMLNAHFFNGDEAAALGLLDKSVPANELDAAVESEIAELLQCAPGAVATSKQLIKRVAANQADEDACAELLAEIWEREEAKEGIAAFFEKRPAKWMRGK
ncbi:MAG: enoyl-CoA hydratase-related protein [Gammaproteobacteria bacterium]|nr:enoyl-CoA hydratase-related protein [Gammaproteobacteria bacterium]